MDSRQAVLKKSWTENNSNKCRKLKKIGSAAASKDLGIGRFAFIQNGFHYEMKLKTTDQRFYGIDCLIPIKWNLCCLPSSESL